MAFERVHLAQRSRSSDHTVVLNDRA
jgi:hypothetical protein